MGVVHFPEEQLTTYLRVFIPEGRLDAVLDEIAQAAIESEVDDEMELFALAHWMMDADDRRTDELEAAVLVAEVGLAPEEVAYILDLQVEDVQAAVDVAWAEVAADVEDAEVEDAEVEDGPDAPTTRVAEQPEAAVMSMGGTRLREGPVVTSVVGLGRSPREGADTEVAVPEAPAPEGRVAPEATDTEVGAPEAPPLAAPPPVASPIPAATTPRPARDPSADPAARAPSPPGRRSPSPGWLLVGPALVALTVLAVAVFSEAGQARLIAVGLDPVVAFVVVIGLIGGGGALIKAGSEPGPRTTRSRDRRGASAAAPSDAPAEPSPR